MFQKKESKERINSGRKCSQIWNLHEDEWLISVSLRFVVNPDACFTCAVFTFEDLQMETNNSTVPAGTKAKHPFDSNTMPRTTSPASTQQKRFNNATKLIPAAPLSRRQTSVCDIRFLLQFANYYFFCG